MPVPEVLLEEAARRFALLSDPTRLRLLSALLEQGPSSVGELADAIAASTPNVSQHLSRLLGAGIVGRERAGREVRYAIADASIKPLCDLMCSSLRDRAERLAVRLGAETAAG